MRVHHEVFMLLGSNQGDRLKSLRAALDLIRTKAGEIPDCSSVYETEPWQMDSGSWFLNLAVRIQTQRTPFQLLTIVTGIEHALGRRKTGRNYEDRPVDIDILLYDDLVISDQKLTIPHPLMHLRRFTLVPLNEIAPGKFHPVLNKTVAELLNTCSDNLTVRIASNITGRET